MQENNNPFQAPTAVVADQARKTNGFIPEGRKISVGDAIGWLGTGWQFFKESPGIWVVIALISIVISAVISFIPIINMLAGLLYPILAGGMMLGCKAIDDGESLSVGHLFAGFSNHIGKLFLIGLFEMIYIFAVVMFGGILVAIFMPMFHTAGGFAMTIAVLLGIILFVLIAFPMFIFTWLAPALVVLQDESSIQAMTTSFKIVFANIIPFVVFMIIIAVLWLLACLPMLLGLLIFVPVMFGAAYAAYSDIFFEEVA